MRNELIEEYFMASTSMQRAWKHRIFAVLQDENISVAQTGLLFIINEHKSVISKDLAKFMHITRSAVAQLLEGLSEQGYVTKTEDTKDRRITHISLSKKGVDKMKQLDKQRRSIFNRLVEGLSDEQLTAAIEINKSMLEQLED